VVYLLSEYNFPDFFATVCVDRCNDEKCWKSWSDEVRPSSYAVTCYWVLVNLVVILLEFDDLIE
jgi:hypothetical protein